MFTKVKELVAQLDGPVKNYNAAKRLRMILQEVKKEAQVARLAIIAKVKAKDYDKE